MREPGAPRDRSLPGTVISRIAMSCQRVRLLTYQTSGPQPNLDKRHALGLSGFAVLSESFTNW